jgi:hypothetical protein|tara:strand:+ start:96 stop:500 length:405 start_codon:yes stop_codon:yes gene_type:complete
MIEYMVGYVLAIVIMAMIYLYGTKTQKNAEILNQTISKEGDLVKENMNHIASAIVGLSELLEEADSIIEDASRIPTMGEMMQQMLQGFIMQKMAPMMQSSTMQSIIPDTPQDDSLWQGNEANQNLDDHVVEESI